MRGKFVPIKVYASETARPVAIARKDGPVLLEHLLAVATPVQDHRSRS